MDKFGGLQSVTRRLASHLLCGNLAQFLIDEREQVGSRLGVPLLNGLEYVCDLGHAASVLQNDARRNNKITRIRGRRLPK
jgi:hypothetical protein